MAWNSVTRRLRRKPFAIVGHRGAKGLAPENTLAALRRAIEAGADVAEFDVQFTGDGVAVAAHDRVIVSDDGRRVDVRASSYEELRSVRVGGEPVPRIEELVKEARGRIGLFLEIKEPGDAEPLAKLVKELGALDDVAFISFEEEAIKRVRSVASSAAAGLVYFRPPGKIVECKRLRCEIVLPRYPLATKKAVAFAHRLGLVVVAWTVNEETLASRLLENGVDALATDYPDRLAAFRERIAQGMKG